MLQEKTYWHDTVTMPSGSDLTSLPAKVDVAVIGAGYTGLSAALSLAKRGVRVVVLDAEIIGWGASSRNGGMVLPGLKLGMDAVMRKYGRDVARQMYKCSLDSIETVEEVVKQEHIDCGFTRTGHVVAASKPQHYEALAVEVEFMAREFNRTVRVVPQAEQRSEIGSDAFYGLLVDESSAGLNPAQYVVGLARAAAGAGAALCEQARVTKLGKSAAGFAVETARGKVLADKILVATSGYTGRVTRGLQKKVIPIGSYIIATERLREDVAEALNPHGRMIFDTKHYLHYFRLWDQRLIFGGRAAFSPETGSTVRQSAEILRRDMLQVYPQLRDAQIEFAWGGTLDFTFDMMPHIGGQDGLWYSLGYAGHGVAMATYLGKTVAEGMLSGGLKDHPFAAYPFPGAPLGLYNGQPWFLPFVGMWYRILDLVE